MCRRPESARTKTSVLAKPKSAPQTNLFNPSLPHPPTLSLPPLYSPSILYLFLSPLSLILSLFLSLPLTNSLSLLSQLCSPSLSFSPLSFPSLSFTPLSFSLFLYVSLSALVWVYLPLSHSRSVSGSFSVANAYLTVGRPIPII